MENFKNVMYDELTKDQQSLLTRDQMALWLFRPKPDDQSAALWAMYVRVAAIVICSIYFYARSQNGPGTIMFALLAYEYAYFNTRRAKVTAEYELAKQEYLAQVEKLESEA